MPELRILRLYCLYHMSFSNPSDSEFTRRYSEELAMVFSAIDCVLHGDHAIYASSELSSGFRLYQALRERGLKTAAELKQSLGDDWFQANIWEVNVKAAIDFSENVRGRFFDRTVVVTPAPFAARGWSQDQYLSLWEGLLRTRIKSVWFNSNWQYSNGCAFEFAVARDAGLETLDRRGAPLSLSAGAELIREAAGQLERGGFDAKKLRDSLGLLQGK